MSAASAPHFPGTTSEVFQYRHVDFRRQVLKKGMLKRKRLPSRWFKPKARSTSLKMNDLVGTNPTPTWPSWNAQSQKVQWCDASVMRHCLKDGSLNKLANHWLCVLCPAGVIFKRKAEAQWRMSLSFMGYTGVLTIGVESFVINGKQCFSPKLPVGPQSLEWVAVFDLDDFEGFRVAWRGPAYKEYHGWPNDAPGLVCESLDGAPVDLGTLGALSCFYSLRQAVLNRLAKHYRVEVPSGASLFVLLKALIAHFIPDISDERLLEIMSVRVKLDDEAVVSWFDVGCAEVIGEEDYEEIEKDATAEQAKTQALLPLRESFVALHKTVQAKRAAVAMHPPKRRRKKESSSSTAAASSSSGRRNYPMAPLADEMLPKEEARKWLPDMGFRLHKDERNGRWLLYDGCPACVTQP